MPANPLSPHPDADEVAAALAAWQREHPDATLAEIEVAVDQHLRDFRIRLITETAHAGEEPARPDCPACGTPMHKGAMGAVDKVTTHDGVVRLRGQTWVCPACGAGLFPPR